MGTGYQEEKKEQYEKMMEEIAAHPDFRKRNPVDIGVECGYQEEAVMEMMCFLQGNKDEQGALVGQSTKKKTESRQKEERDKYYFLQKRHINIPVEEYAFMRREKTQIARTGYYEYTIVAVDINTWKLEQVKKVEEPFLFRIKETIYAWVDPESLTKLKWEDLESKDHGEFSADSNIQEILIAEDGIAAVTQKSFVLFRFQGETKRTSLGVKGNPMLLEESDVFYIISVYRENGNTGSIIWKIEKNDFREKMIFENPGVGITVVECSDEGLIWYAEGSWQKHAKMAETRDIWRKYTEKNLPNFTTESAYNLGGKQVKKYGCTKGLNTKNYKLLQRRIHKKGTKGWYDFKRKMPYGILGYEFGAPEDRDICSNQVVGIYEKDIFIGINEGGDIIKIDLNKDETPVILGKEWLEIKRKCVEDMTKAFKSLF